MSESTTKPHSESKTQVTKISTPNAPAPLPFYSQAIVCNGMVYCSGQVALDPATGVLVEDGGVGGRTNRCILNLSAVLTAAGSSLSNVVRVGVFLASMDDFAAMNSVYETHFAGKEEGKPKPARTCVAVRQLPMGTDVEVECVAYL